MRKYFFLLLIPALMMACGQDKAIVKEMDEKAMALHDEVMPKMKEIIDLKGEIKFVKTGAGQTFEAPSGYTLTMDEKNHHLHKPVMIGEVQDDGQFSVVWETESPVRAQPWSPYIPGNDKKPDYAVKSN